MADGQPRLTRGRGNQMSRFDVLAALEHYSNLLLTLLSIASLSRLLTPHEFGIYFISGSIRVS